MVCKITFARSWQALVATRALGKAGIKHWKLAFKEKIDFNLLMKYSKVNKEMLIGENPKK